MKQNGSPALTGETRVADALAAAARALAATSPTPRLDAELLMAFALGVEREAMLLRYMESAAPPGFDALVERRRRHEPVAYIVGRRDFWTISLKVGPGVLIPRPDSETLIEAAIAHFGSRSPASILDLGTGPGTLLLAALSEWPDAEGLGIDASDVALSYARRNAEALDLTGRARWRQGNWAHGIERRFDLILANPPYIGPDELLPADVRDYEPAEALFAGGDGLDAHRAIVPALPGLISPGGVAVIEIGATQADAVAALAGGVGLGASLRRDLAGLPRAIVILSGRPGTVI